MAFVDHVVFDLGYTEFPVMQDRKPVVVIIDNSISFTGAFKCALTEALLLRSSFDFVFVLPSGTTITDIVARHGFRYYTLPMLEISRSPRNLLLYWPRLFQNTMRLSRILKKEAADVVQVNDFYNLLGVSAKMWGFKGSLVTYVRFLPFAIPAPLRKLWIRLAQTYANAIVAVSDAVFKQLPPHKKNIRVYDAIILEENQPPKPFTAANDCVTFVYLGNYIKGKGQDHAVRAFHAAVQKNTNIILKFVGGDMGLRKNKEFKSNLQQYVAENGLSNRVFFDTFQPDIERVIKEADVVLNFAEAESFSMTCAEASYYGVPVIATRCGGPEELLLHEKTGLLVGNKNVAEMTDAILLLAQSPSLRRQYGTAAAAFIKATFTAQQYIQAFTNVLNCTGLTNEN